MCVVSRKAERPGWREGGELRRLRFDVRSLMSGEHS